MKKIFVLLILFYMIFLSCSFSRKSKKVDMRNESLKFIKYLNQSKFKKAGEMFHYSNEKDRKNNKEIINTLICLQGYFGKIEIRQKCLNKEDYFSFAITGAELEYWNNYKETFNNYYEVHFEKQGPGYFGFAYCNINDKLEIRHIEFGFPKNKKKSKAKYKTIIENIIKISQE